MNVSLAKRATLLLGILAISGCASHYVGAGEEPYGFFSGIWHGVVFPFALIANLVSWLVGVLGLSLFESIQLVGRPNSGFWYYVGFAIGLSACAGGSSARA